MRGKSTRPVSFSTRTSASFGRLRRTRVLRLLDGALAEDRRLLGALRLVVVVLQRAEQRVVRVAAKGAAIGALIDRAEPRDEDVVLQVQLRGARRGSPLRRAPRAASAASCARHRAL